jgi:hypothetical protein
MTFRSQLDCKRNPERKSGHGIATMKLSDVVTAIQSANGASAPLYLWGAPGIGKTAIVQAAAELLGIELLTLRVNLLEPVDFLGLPCPAADGDRVKWLAPDFLPRPGTTGLLFLDEFAQAPQATQCAAMRLVDHLPDGWQVVAASNRTTDRAGAGQVATHVLSRFTHLEVDASRQDWQVWAQRSGIAPQVRAFIDFRPALLFSFDAAQVQKDRAHCSPRAWHRISRLMNTPDDLKNELFAGTVGQGPAAEFIGFLQIYANCPSPDLILADPINTPVPTDPSALFAICAALADRARTLEPAKLASLITYLAKLPIEFGAVLMTDVLAVAPTVLTIPAAGAWINKHKHIFASPRA